MEAEGSRLDGDPNCDRLDAEAAARIAELEATSADDTDEYAAISLDRLARAAVPGFSRARVDLSESISRLSNRIALAGSVADAEYSELYDAGESNQSERRRMSTVTSRTRMGSTRTHRECLVDWVAAWGPLSGAGMQ